MKIIKEERNVEVLVNIRYITTETELIQSFEFVPDNKKDLRYLFDKRFLFKKRIEDLIEKMLLDNFKERIDSTDKIIIKYEKQEPPKNCIRKIQAYIPPYLGCNYCVLAQTEGEFIYCPIKNKHYTKIGGVKRCPVFKSKEKILT